MAKLKIAAWLLAYFLCGIAGSVTLRGQTIDNFPYNLAPNADGWTIYYGEWGDNENIITNNSGMIELRSPQIDLTNGGGGELLLEVGIGESILGTKGIIFTAYGSDESVIFSAETQPLDLTRDNECYLYPLPEEVKSVHIIVGGFDAATSIKSLTIRSDGYHGSTTGNTFTLPSSDIAAGEERYYWLPKVADVTTSLSTKASFEIQASGNHEIYFVERFTDYTIKETLINSTGGSGARVLLEPFRATGIMGFKVKANAAATPDITIDNYRIESLGENANMQHDLAYWYDMDNDGMMEFSIGGKGKVFDVQRGFYKIASGEPAKYADYPENAAILKPQNIDNNGIIDFVDTGNNGTVYIDGTQAVELSSSDLGGSMIVCDYDNDGLADFLLDDNTVAVQLHDGSFQMRHYETYTQAEYLNRDKTSSEWAPTYNNSSNIVSSSFGDAFLSGEDMFIGSGNGSYGDSMGAATANIDFDKDGMPDIINTATGNVMLYVGNDKYVTLPMGGSICFRDLNGDQQTDYIVYEPETRTVAAHLCHADGSKTSQQLMSNMSMDFNMWCYDFDRDGDIDVLLPFSYIESNGATFLVLMENDGSGKFKMHETAFDEKITFTDCADIDGDGYLDVIAVYSDLDDTSDYYRVFMIKGGANFKFELSQLVELEKKATSSYYLSSNANVADIDGDGYFELLTACTTTNGSQYREESIPLSQVYEITRLLDNVKVNNAPRQPNPPTCIYEAATGLLKVSWQQGEDAESSPADLTYALRIGTSPGKGDIFYAHATADGTRLNLMDGNMGHALDHVFDASGWNAGKYYIALQAIDPMHKGSAWSQEAVFEKKQLNAHFILTDERTVCDTITLALKGGKNASLEYDWNLDGGEIVSQNADGSTLKIRFASPGEKRITLQVSDGSGNMASTDKQLYISANKIAYDTVALDPAETKIWGTIDMDGDGVPELLTGNGVYENTGKEKYVKLRKIYNTNLEFQPKRTLVADIDMDGMPDVAELADRSDQYRLMLNQGDKTLAVESHTGMELRSNSITCLTRADFNNDGYIDYSYALLNSGDYLNFTAADIEQRDKCHIADVDRDGFFDVVWATCEGGNVVVAINNGNGNFTETSIPITIADFPGSTFSILAVADIDNNGFPDVVMMMNDMTAAVLFNDRNQSFNKILKLSLPREMDVLTANCIDLDNNGVPDILLHDYYGNYGNGALRAIYMESDLSYTVSEVFTGGPNSGITVFIDYNNDDTPDFDTLDDYSYNGIYYSNHTTTPNSRPAAPGNVRGAQDENFVTLQWDAATDAETPATQMRYNISVKRKGASGEGAYVISPMNCDNADAAILPLYAYPSATTYRIPVSAIPAGDYEVRVQAIDAWNATSPFSATYALHVDANPQMQVATTIHADMPTVVTYTGNASTSGLEWNWDGGTLLSHEGNRYTVVWAEAGDKQISVTSDGATSTVSVTVLPAIDATFAIAANTLAGAATPITVPQGADYRYGWTISTDGGNNFGSIEEYASVTATDANARCNITFKAVGNYILRLTVTSGNCSVASERQVTVADAHDYVAIDLVRTNNDLGKHEISWTASEAMPSYFSNIVVYKESSRYNDFVEIATVPVSAGSYIDDSSNPAVCASRYCIAVTTKDGMVSPLGEPHKSVHVMLGKAASNGWNVMWSQYEGATVETFRIWRGTSPSNMEVIAEVAGSANSYADLNAPDGTLYYALDFSIRHEATARRSAALRSNAASSIMSNVISTDDAMEMIYAEWITIATPQEGDTSSAAMQLFATVYPLNATFRNVNWSITEGGDIASIDANGLLVATGSGNVVVRATASDGSGTYAEKRITVTSSIHDAIETGDMQLSIYPVPATDVLNVAGLSGGRNRITVYNLWGQMMHREETSASSVSIPCSAYPSGIYIIKVENDKAAMTLKFTKN